MARKERRRLLGLIRRPVQSITTLIFLDLATCWAGVRSIVKP